MQLVLIPPPFLPVSGDRGDTVIRCALVMIPGPSLRFCHIQNTAVSIDSTFHVAPVLLSDRLVRWNSNNYNCGVLNVDGSCLGTPTRAGYGGIIRNSAGFYLSGFSSYLAATSDILFAELSAIHRGLLLAVEAGIEEMVCYSDSMLSINLVTDQASNFHAYAVLI